MKSLSAVLASGVLLSALAGCSSSTPDDEFKPAIEAFLARHGHICLGMRDWPIDVTPAEVAGGARNAIQLPVLLQLGLVTASKAQATYQGSDDTPAQIVTVDRYALTDMGRQFYRDGIGYRTRDGKSMTGGDLCAADVSLDRVQDATPPVKLGDRDTSTVSYTYRIAAAPWTTQGRAPEVFPVVTNLVAGAGKAIMTADVVKTANGWAPSDELK